MHLSRMRCAVIVGKGLVGLANRIDDKRIAAFVMADRFSVPGRFRILRMPHIQIDVAHLRPGLHDDRNFVWPLIDEKRRAHDVRIKGRNTGWPATFMGTVGYSAGEHLVVRLFHRRLHPVLQNRIGEIRDTIGWNPATGRHVRMDFVEGDGPRSALRYRNQIVYAKGAVKLPTGLVVRSEHGNGRISNRIGRQTGTRSREDGYQERQTEFGHVSPLSGTPPPDENKRTPATVLSGNIRQMRASLSSPA